MADLDAEAAVHAIYAVSSDEGVAPLLKTFSNYFGPFST